MTRASAPAAPTPKFSTDAQMDANRFMAEAVEILTKARALVDLDNIGAAGLLRIDRARIFELLGRYQRFKHAVVFDPVIQGADPSQAAAARELKCECIMMGNAFAEYVERWQHVDVAIDWSIYCHDMVSMNDRLRGHIRSEHKAITTLLSATAKDAAASK